MYLNYIILQAQIMVSIPVQSNTLKMNLAGFEGMSNGTELLITGVSVLVLFWFYHTFFVVPRINARQTERKKTIDTLKSSQHIPDDASELSDEVSAVIGLALHLYMQQLNDYEKARLTIARVSRTYSPWSSKIYGLRQNPRR